MAIGLSLNVLDVRLFTMMVLVAVFTTGLAGSPLPILLAAGASEPRRPRARTRPDDRPYHRDGGNGLGELDGVVAAAPAGE